MDVAAVGDLYDALHAFEVRRGRETAYPVHKKLDADRLGAEDIYDWIINRIGLPRAGSILDAGCGVGYGSFRLAERTGCAVTGISVSPRECDCARNLASLLDMDQRVRFERQSFDEVPAQSYDAVVAVESLKHSFDLSRSLDSLARALRPNGTLVIVEDFYRGDANARTAKRLRQDWGLTRLYAERDYLEPLGASLCRVVDLTAAVRLRHRHALRLVVIALGLARPLMDRPAHCAFRGGLFLERLYCAGEIDYKAIVFRRELGSAACSSTRY